MPTKGIKTSLHETRHAIIAELFGLNVHSINVTERFNGYTRYNKPCTDKIMHLIISMAPYIKRIKTQEWNTFMSEYGGLSDIWQAIELIKHARNKNIFNNMIDVLDSVLEDNINLVNTCVSYLDRNGKGTPERISRNQFDAFILMYPLKSKDKLYNLLKELKDKW